MSETLTPLDEQSLAHYRNLRRQAAQCLSDAAYMNRKAEKILAELRTRIPEEALFGESLPGPEEEQA